MSPESSGLSVPLPEVVSTRVRKRQVLELATARAVVVGGEEYVQFSSNDYLGLSRHPSVIKAFRTALDHYGASSASSPLITGYQAPHHALVARLCDWLGRDDVLLFSSGFAANSGILKLLSELYPEIYLDKLSHASLLDGVRQGRGWSRFKHQDFTNLEHLLAKSGTTEQPQLVVTEGVFSMDGDITDAGALYRCLQPDDQSTTTNRLRPDLFIDDAHALGVLGPAGTGVGGSLKQAQVPLLTATFGKALGGAGAFFAGAATVVDYLVQYCREYMYSTAFPAAQAAAVSAAIDICRGDEGDALRYRLQNNINHFRQAAASAGLTIMPSITPIQGILMGAEGQALNASEALRQRHIWCHPIRPPTVPANQSRLRITITAAHQQQDIDQLIGALQEYAQ